MFFSSSLEVVRSMLRLALLAVFLAQAVGQLSEFAIIIIIVICIRSLIEAVA